MEICCKTQFFKVLSSIFRLEGVFRVTKAAWGCLYVSGTNWKKYPLNPGNFPVLALFFHLSFPKIWLTHPHKNYIFEIIKDRAIISQSVAILV